MRNQQFDEPHAKRPVQNFSVRLFKHGFERAVLLRAYNPFRHLVGAERHAPLFVEEHETHHICRSLADKMRHRAGLDTSGLHGKDGLICSD